MVNPTADREIVVTRLFDASPEIVFAAFTEREHVEKWWVPSGTTIHEWNAKPGGLWRYRQPGPDGDEIEDVPPVPSMALQPPSGPRRCNTSAGRRWDTSRTSLMLGRRW